MLKKKKLLLPICLSIFFIINSAFAAPNVKVIAFDNMSCDAWKKSASDEDDRLQYIAWIRGVLTGHNYVDQQQQISVISNATVENFVTRYCAENSKGDIASAAFRMSDRYSGRNKAITK